MWRNEHSSWTHPVTQAKQVPGLCVYPGRFGVSISGRTIEVNHKSVDAGMELEDIAKWHKRKPEEVFLALFHQAMENKVTRAFAYRKRGG